MRSQSHHDITTATRKPPRPERKGSVYSEAIELTSPATSTKLGMTTSTTLSTTCPGVSPNNAKSSKVLLRPSTHVNPVASTWNVSRHVCGNACCRDRSMLLTSWESLSAIVAWVERRAASAAGRINSTAPAAVKRGGDLYHVSGTAGAASPGAREVVYWSPCRTRRPSA